MKQKIQQTGKNLKDCTVDEYWQRSDDKPHAMCLGSKLMYSEPTLSSLADSGYRTTSSFMPSEAKMLRDAVLQSIKFKIDSKK